MTDDDFARRLRKFPDIEEVFIHENPKEDKLKQDGWERFPATWRGKQIWIRRKPRSDQKKLVETSA